jgi:two-component system OmpR family response regulator
MKVLLVEDEPSLRNQLRESLLKSGYVVDEASNGTDALHLGMTEDHDAVILDLGLPELDGMSVLKRWRAAQRRMPVLILTARDDWSDKVAGIDAGADDYLSKPFHIEEVLARVRALIRRAAGQAQPVLQWGHIELDTRTGRVQSHGQEVALTGHEYKVLAYLLHRPGAVVSRSELIDHIYAQDHDRDSNTIEVFIGRIRKKLQPDPIETVRGLGYRLIKP